MTTIARIAGVAMPALLAALAVAAGPAAASRGPAHPHGMPNGWAAAHGATGGAMADPDRDGLTNWGEWRANTRPGAPDTDRDGTRDDAEDRDRDGLANGVEEAVATDPRHRDSDRDGVRDGDEDADRDGLDNAAEQESGTDPDDRDSDDDGVRDGSERTGVVSAVEGELVTVALAAGGSVTARVDDGTEIECVVHGRGRGRGRATESGRRTDDRFDEPGGEDDHRSGHDESGSDEDSGDDDRADDHDDMDRAGVEDDADGEDDVEGGRHDDRRLAGHRGGSSCATTLTVGAVVAGARIAVRADGPVFTELELRT